MSARLASAPVALSGRSRDRAPLLLALATAAVVGAGIGAGSRTAILLLGASLRRATFGVFGIAGFYAPIAHYFETWFGNLGVAFALTALGLGLVALGIGARIYGDAVPVFRRRTPAVT